MKSLHPMLKIQGIKTMLYLMLLIFFCTAFVFSMLGVGGDSLTFLSSTGWVLISRLS